MEKPASIGVGGQLGTRKLSAPPPYILFVIPLYIHFESSLYFVCYPSFYSAFSLLSLHYICFYSLLWPPLSHIYCFYPAIIWLVIPPYILLHAMSSHFICYASLNFDLLIRLYLTELITGVSINSKNGVFYKSWYLRLEFFISMPNVVFYNNG